MSDEMSRHSGAEKTEDLGAPTVTVADVTPEPKGVEGQREIVRAVIGIFLVVLLGVIVIAGVVSLIASWSSIDETKTLSELFLTPVIALVSSVVGFYFGAQTAQSAQRAASGGPPPRRVRRRPGRGK
jgi:hypothetical protein